VLILAATIQAGKLQSTVCRKSYRRATRKDGSSGGERRKIGKFDIDHRRCRTFEDTLQESIKSARVWGYTRAAAPGKAALISLANGDPLLIEQKVGAGKLMLFTTMADRDLERFAGQDGLLAAGCNRWLNIWRAANAACWMQESPWVRQKNYRFRLLTSARAYGDQARQAERRSCHQRRKGSRPSDHRGE